MSTLPAGDKVSITVTSTETTKVNGEKVVSVLDKRTDIKVTHVSPETATAASTHADAEGTGEEQPSSAEDHHDEAAVSTSTITRVEHTKRIITTNSADLHPDDLTGALDETDSEDFDAAQLLQEMLDAGLQSRGGNKSPYATTSTSKDPVAEARAKAKANQDAKKNDPKKGDATKKDAKKVDANKTDAKKSEAVQQGKK
ncbi:hypothetical protein BC835DRAFT_1317269 [Cytidiella melzeri]|nr:hypothetical protein BC835DRAFT_1317269 [Cytidiella melzeri]